MSTLAAWMGALGVAPLVWSALVALARQGAVGEASLSDGHEKALLAIMLGPIALGAIMLLASSGAGSTVAPPLLELIEFSQAGNVTSATEINAHEAINWWEAVAATLLGFYLLGLFRLVPPLVRAHLSLRRSEIAACAHPVGRDVYVFESTGSPVAAARGLILIPRRLFEALSPEQLALIVEHERKHHARGDVMFYAALAWIEALLWFNPFVRAQARHCRLAAELDCDRAVTAAAPDMRRAYAQTLLVVLKHTAGDALPCAPAVFSHRTMGDHRMRIVQIMERDGATRKRAPWFAYAAAVALIAPLGIGQLALAQSLGVAPPANITPASASSAPSFSHRPVEGRLTSTYGERRDPFSGQMAFHVGVDLAAREGTPVVAAASGHVLRVAANQAGYGNMIEVDHGGGFVLRYSQLSAFEVREGDAVQAGQLIGRVGQSGRATGPHLHLEVWRDGTAWDPALFLDLPAVR
ncbi:MAG: M23/M56 family metallopeptidase [Hyphomonadaceae bacterium]